MATLPDQWIKMLMRLQAYQQEHNGSCNVPKRYHPDPQLGNWVQTQRHYYKKGLLAKERCHYLEAIGFEWTVREVTEWTKMFKRLQAYQQEHNGSCDVPNKYPSDQQLGNWVNCQRKRYRKGLLAKERCDQLEATGFEWKGNEQAKMQTYENKWNKMFRKLQAYQQEHNGSCNLPFKYSQNPKLGKWVSVQRQRYKKGLLTKERCDQLEAIGFLSRGQSFQDRWVEMFKRLQAYQQEHNGTCNVPFKYPQDPKLGKWVSMQRQRYKKGLLAKERCEQLNAIGFEWRSSTRTNHRMQQSDQSGTEGSLRWCWL